jgi:hypothetical protein
MTFATYNLIKWGVQHYISRSRDKPTDGGQEAKPPEAEWVLIHKQKIRHEFLPQNESESNVACSVNYAVSQ